LHAALVVLLPLRPASTAVSSDNMRVAGVSRPVAPKAGAPDFPFGRRELEQLIALLLLERRAGRGECGSIICAITAWSLSVCFVVLQP
jgi:hypothetical protein